MQCQACGRQFETYIRICPYCRTKNPETPHQPIANDALDRQSSPSTPPATSPPAERPRPKVFIPTDRLDESPDPAVPSSRPESTGSRGPRRRSFPGRALKGILACGLFLLVVLVGWAALSSVPGLLPVTLTIGTHPAPDTLPPTLAASTTKPTIATPAPTRVADTTKPYPADPDTTRRIAPGYRVTTGTRAPATATTGQARGSIVGSVTPSPTDSAILPNWTGGDMRSVGNLYPLLSTVEEHVLGILAPSLGNDWRKMKNSSEELKRTTAEGISKSLPLPVSPNVSDVKNQSLGILDRLASEGDRYIAAADSHVRGNETATGSLIAGSEEIMRVAGDLERIGEYLPKELTEPK